MIYEEDRFNPINYDDYDIDTMRRNHLDELNKHNKGYFQMSLFDENNGKKIKVGLFASGSDGTIIRHAVSGSKMNPYLVGSKYEDLFFKVAICSGEFGNKEPFTLFFESPEEYEKHMRVELSDDAKQRWLEKKSFVK